MITKRKMLKYLQKLGPDKTLKKQDVGQAG